MRMDQWRGLTEDARKFLDEHAAMIPGDKCPQCGCILNHKRDCKEREWVKGMFGDSVGPLFDYKLKDGRIAKEVVQTVASSSGSVFFICLKIDGVKCFEWPEEKIRDA